MACRARNTRGKETELSPEWERDLKLDLERHGILAQRWTVHALMAAGYTHVQLDDGGWLELRGYA